MKIPVDSDTLTILSEGRKISERITFNYSGTLVGHEGLLRDIMVVAAQAAVTRAQELLKQLNIDGVVVSTGGPGG